MKNSFTYHVNDPDFKLKALKWALQFEQVCYLDSHIDSVPEHMEINYGCLIGIGTGKAHISSTAGLTDILDRKEWFFGHLGYDLKNQIENLKSENNDGIGFQDLFFFKATLVLKLENSSLTLLYDDEEFQPTDIIENIEKTDISLKETSSFDIKSRFTKTQFIKAIEGVKEEIKRGEVYELNLCQEFYADAKIDPYSVFQGLHKASPTPYTAFYKVNDKYLLCASPERFLKKQGSRISSEPMKGTVKRGATAEEDMLLVNKLKHDPKEVSENVMIVDLVRNDLSKVCVPGTVKVEDFCGVYTFKQVHQMVSTVVGELKNNISFKDIVTATFPMGSMTGAPKIRAMELIEKYEKTQRGLYSGALGYIDPEGNFDFNVVIRSIQYNSQDSYLSFSAGSAITYYCDSEKEYEECLLKTSAITKVLGV